jgi:predicted amidohydrolase YtcJ
MATTGASPQLIFHNANVITVDPKFRKARAVAIAGNRIAEVGADEEVLKRAGPDTQLVDLHGNTVVPGFIDAHVHAIHVGVSLLPGYVQFNDCRSISDMLAAIARKAESTPGGEWIQGSGHFDFDLIHEGRFPNRWELDRAVPNHPFFMRIRGHLGVANSKALEVLGVTKNSPVPAGGYVFKDERGELTGLMLDNAVYDLAMPKLPRTTREEWLSAIRLMNQRFLREGITSAVNQSGETLSYLEELKRRGELTTRWQANHQGSSNYFHRPVEDIPKAVRDLGAVTGQGDAWLRAGAIGELHSDGLIEAPWMHEPYAQDQFGPNWKGLLRHDRETLRAICLAAADRGFQMEVHASGDAAMEMVLDIYEEVNRQVSVRDRRWLVTHGGILPTPRSVERARNLGIIVSTQQPVLWTQSHYYKQFWGQRAVANVFANRTWLEGGVLINGSSDVGISPLLGIYMYVTRKNFFGEALGPEQAISREEAIKLFTIYGAYSTFEEKLKGSIEAGKLADLAVLSDDPLTVPEEKIKEIQVLMTVVDGKIAYEKSGSATNKP